MMKYIKLLRIKHYVKNLLIFLPIVFGMQLSDIKTDFKLLIGFVAFSFMTSVVYILNDIKDVEKDKMHPKKKDRPIASGMISIQKAVCIAVILFIVSSTLNFYISQGISNKLYCWVMLIGYLVINLVYSVLGAKNIPLLDVVLIMLGFLFRVYYGSAISEIPVSIWMCLVICSGAFYMGFGKRRNELCKTADKTRTVLRYYTKEFLDHVMNCCMTLTITFYSLWCLTQVQIGKSSLYVGSIPILMILMFKYSMNVENPENMAGGDPIEVILSDRILIILATILAFYMGMCLYYF